MGIYDKIYEIPPVPPEIIECVNNNSLAVFVGAGVPRVVGCCGWDELASRLVTAQLRDGDLASESFQDDSDLLVCGESLAGGLSDLLNDTSWFGTHNHSSFLGYDAPLWSRNRRRQAFPGIPGKAWAISRLSSAQLSHF